MVLIGEMDTITVGKRGTHYYRTASIAHSMADGYNGTQSNKRSLDAEVDWFFQAVYPLRKGKVIKLWMDLPNPTKPRISRKPARRLVILTPGAVVGLTSKVVLVSVVGAGACILRPLMKEGMADLVLAGMPAKLAQALMNAVRRTFT